MELKADIPIGETFGRVTVLHEVQKTSNNTRVKCKCSCGTEFDTDLIRLKIGRTTSCGCFRLERIRQANSLNPKRLIHGHKRRTHTSREYHSWQAMIDRCNNPDLDSYKYYGGRGISVCNRWLGSFVSFLADLGPRPEGMTLERKDVNGNYEPDNCKWATLEEQGMNKRPRLNWVDRDALVMLEGAK